MRICDRCEEKQIMTKLVNQITHEEYDLCLSCSTEFGEWMGKVTEVEMEKRRPERPKKEV